MRNHYRNISLMKIQNVSIFLFPKKQPQKRTNFPTFYLIFEGPPFQYHKVRHPNFCNILHLKLKKNEKGQFLHKIFDKSLVKNTINEILKKIE